MKKNTHNDESARMALEEDIQKVLEYNKNRESMFEIAIPRKNYKKRIDDLVPRLFECWCLAHYCTIVGQTQDRKHWTDELRQQLITISRLSIKGNDSEESRKKVLQEIWDENDYDVPMFLNLTVVNRFIQEHIDEKSELYGQVIEDCINSKQNIFDAILSRNADAIVEYVNLI